MSDSETSEPELDDADIPDVKTCQELCEQFAGLTGTDTACAQFYMQSRKWDLTRSVNDYFDEQKRREESDKDGQQSGIVVSFMSLGTPVTAAPAITNNKETGKKLKFISWNVDGLDSRSLKRRVKKICEVINCELPDVVHLQEIVPESYCYIVEHLSTYKCIPGNDFQLSEYLTVTLLRMNSVTYEEHEIVSFPASLMGRNLLIVKAKIASTPLTLINTHLESTAQHAKERKNQLKTAFQKCLSVDSGRLVVFGGDLNLRDKELEEVGGIPASLEDLWITCGKRPECEYTWDGRRNTNIEMACSYKARCRFDRIYLRRPNQSEITPQHFGLIGLEKIPACGRFPSDHWGIVIHFDL